MSEPGAGSWLWSKHQTGGLPVWYGRGYSSGKGYSFTNPVKIVQSCASIMCFMAELTFMCISELLPSHLHMCIASHIVFFIRLRQTSVLSPGDIVKVRLQCQTESKQGGTNMPKPKYHGPVHCLLSIIKEEGFMGLYRGMLPLMLRDGPSFATYFLTYTTICEWLTDSGKQRPGE